MNLLEIPQGKTVAPAVFIETSQSHRYPSVADAFHALSMPITVIESPEGALACSGGHISWDTDQQQGPLVKAHAPALPLSSLGSRTFQQSFGLKYAYVGGSMAKGISSVALVEALGRQGMLSFFGAGGLQVPEISGAIDRLQQLPTEIPWGINLLHSPTEPLLEQGTVDLLLKRQVQLVEAAAYLDLTVDIVRYRIAGIHRGADGVPVAPNRIIAKVSREEIAEKFCSPPPQKFLRELVSCRAITEEQAELAAQIPMADAITAEADSGGHSDNRPMPALFPTIATVRDRAVKLYKYQRPVYLGLGGGIGTPAAAAAAFAMGADFIVTGSINQACIEAGTSDAVRQMLAETRQADIIMAPAADMFEMGGKVQVVKRGTMFSMRASKLYELYKACHDWDQVPPLEQEKLEKSVFQMSFAAVWEETKRFFSAHDPAQIRRAEADSRHKMALVFRWYLGMSPRWANQGDLARKIDFQIWCGPAMGAFNEWARGTFLENPETRQVATVALNILRGAALHLRQSTLQQQGLDTAEFRPAFRPVLMEQLKEYLR